MLSTGGWPVRDFDRIGLDECVVYWWRACLELTLQFYFHLPYNFILFSVK